MMLKFTTAMFALIFTCSGCGISAVDHTSQRTSTRSDADAVPVKKGEDSATTTPTTTTTTRPTKPVVQNETTDHAGDADPVGPAEEDVLPVSTLPWDGKTFKGDGVFAVIPTE